MNTNKTIIQNTLFLYLRMIVTIAVGLYASRVVLAVLGESDFGVFSLVGGIVVLLSFLNAGMLQASQRFLAFALGLDDKEEIRKTFWASWYAHLILAVLVVLAGELIGIYLVNYTLSIPAERLFAANWVYQCALFTCAVSIISVPYNSAIIAHERMNFFAYMSILEAVLKLLIVYLLLVFSADKLILYSVLMFAVQSLLRLLYGIYCKRCFEECGSKRVFDRDSVKRILSFAGWSLLGNMGISAKDQGASMLLNIYFQTPVVNAARGLAIQVNSMISTFATNMTMAMNPPIIKRYASGDVNGSALLVYSGCKAAFFMLTVLMVPFVFNIDYVLTLWLDHYPADTPLFIYFIMGSSLWYAMSQPVTVALQATGNIKWFQIWIFILSVAEVCTTACVLWITGSLIGSLIPLVLFSAMATLMRIIILKRLVPEYSLTRYFSDVIARCIFTLGIALGMGYMLHHLIGNGQLIFFLLECLLIGILSLVTVFVLGLNRTEKDYLTTLVINKLKR